MLTALILTPVGQPRAGLHAFLQSISGLELFNGHNGALPLHTLQGKDTSLDVLIFDAYTPGCNHWSLLGAAKYGLAARYCIAIVVSPRQIPQALAAGADCVLLSGFSATEFLQKLKELFPQEE